MIVLTKEQIEPLVAKHIDRYSYRLQMAMQGVRGYSMDSKCYLGLWKSIQGKDCDWGKMNHEERAEALEAFRDE